MRIRRGEIKGEKGENNKNGKYLQKDKRECLILNLVMIMKIMMAENMKTILSMNQEFLIDKARTKNLNIVLYLVHI